MIWHCLNDNFKYRFLLSASIIITSLSYSQKWTKLPLKTKRDSIEAIYAWEVHDKVHSAGGEIVLKKNKRFQYSSFYPLGFHNHSEGSYRIRNGILILSSDFQSDNLDVAIRYKDDLINDTLYSKLKLPIDKKGDTLYNTYYFLNNDTSINSHYDPSFPTNIEPIRPIKSLKLIFYDTDWGSKWIPITEPNKFIQVILLTDVNPDDHNYIVIKDWKFKMAGNKMIKLSK